MDYKTSVKNTVRDMLIAYRKKNDLRQQDVAKALGLYDSSTYRSWETGRSSPKPDMLVKIAQMYNISLDTLMGNTARSGDNRFSIASGNKYNEDVYGDRYLSKLQNNERLIIMKYRQLNSEDKEKVGEFIENILPKQSN